jgi:hypothetical protein
MADYANVIMKKFSSLFDLYYDEVNQNLYKEVLEPIARLLL